MMEMLGHDAPPTNFWTNNLLTGEELSLCPKRAVLLAMEQTPMLVSEVRLHRDVYHPPFRRHGVLPVLGGTAEQPSRAMSYLQEIERLEDLSEIRYAEITKPADEPAPVR